VARQPSLKPPALDVLASLRRPSGGRCRNCQWWHLLTPADLRALARALERVRAANAKGLCLWCSPRAERAERKRASERHLRPAIGQQVAAPAKGRRR